MIAKDKIRSLLLIICIPFVNIILANNIRELPGYDAAYPRLDTIVKPFITAERVHVSPMFVLYIRDTVKGKTMGRMFEIDFVTLFRYARFHKLVAGRPMGFYISRQPAIIEVTIEVDRKPDSLTGNIQYRIAEGGDAIVVRYKGPYEEMEPAFNALTVWLRENNRKPKGLPFEVFLNDPGTIKDKYELKTEVYQLLQ